MIQDHANTPPSDATRSTIEIAALGTAAAIVGWTESADAPGRRGFRLCLDGQTAPPPAAHCSLVQAGMRRHLLAVPFPAARLMQGRLRIVAADGLEVARGDRTGLAAPRTTEFDVLSILPELEPREVVRLARFLLEIAPSVLRLGRDGGYVGLARGLVDALSDGPESLSARCCAGSLAFLETAAQRGIGDRLTAVLVGHDAVAHIVRAPATLPHPKPQRGLARIALAVERAHFAPGNCVVVLGEGGVACRRLPAAEPPSSAFAFALREGALDLPLRDFIADTLIAIDDPARPTTALVRELRAATAGLRTATPSGAVAGGVDLALPTTAGLLVTGWLRDPHRIVDTLIVRRGDRDTPFPVAQLTRLRHPVADRDRATASGFVLVAPQIGDTSPLASVHMLLRLRSGESLALGHGPSQVDPHDALDLALDALAAGPHDENGPAAPIREALHALARGTRTPPGFAALEIGRRVADPGIAVIVPVAGDMELLHCRFAALALEPRFAAQAEIIHAVADPDATETVAAALRRAEQVCGHGTRLVAASRRCSLAAAVNAAAASTSAPVVIVLGTRAMPAGMGWASRLQREFDSNPRAGLIAARRVAEDGSLVDLGFDRETDADGRTRFRPRLAGFPAARGDAHASGKVAACARGAWILRRSLFDLLGGLAEDMLSELGADLDFCCRVRASGFELRLCAEIDTLDLPAAAGARAVREDVALRIDQIGLLERWPFRPVEAAPTPLPGAQTAPLVATSPGAGASATQAGPVADEGATKAKGKGGRRLARKSRSAA